MANIGKKEGLVVKLVPILHSSAVDLGRCPARVEKWARIDGQPIAAFTDFGRVLRDVGALTPLGVNAGFVFDAAQAF